jgi:hypothetical protein
MERTCRHPIRRGGEGCDQDEILAIYEFIAQRGRQLGQQRKTPAGEAAVYQGNDRLGGDFDRRLSQQPPIGGRSLP